MIEYTTALNQIFKVFDDAWTANAPGIVGYVPHILWYGSEEQNLPDRTKYWARVSHKILSTVQTSFRNGDIGQRYTNRGMLSIQIFCPFTVSKGITKGRNLASLARNAYTNKETEGGVWFRGGKIVEGRIDKDWVPLTVLVETQFDELLSSGA
jgi:hypothetical protein